MSYMTGCLPFLLLCRLLFSHPSVTSKLNSSTASFLGLVQGGTQTAAIAAHALGPIPTGGSPALVPTAKNTAAGGARVLPLHQTDAVTLAAG